MRKKPFEKLDNIPFKKRRKTTLILDRECVTTEYQCPVCKRWFTHQDRTGAYNTIAVRMHITKLAKSEPAHFKFYMKSIYEK